VWRFRVPDGETVRFVDARRGPQAFTAGADFGDFVVWRKDDVPAYELAVVADDVAMGVTEVVRGEDLLRSTARSCSCTGRSAPRRRRGATCRWCATPGAAPGQAHQALSVRDLRARGHTPAEVLAMAGAGGAGSA
jgi:glutamyl-tRNA synthetase